MNLILVITMPFGGYTERVLLTDLSGLTAAMESADFKGRIRLKADSTVNCRAVKRLAKIMDGEVKPCRSFLAGNNYFGRVRLEYQRPDLHQEVPATYCLSVQVFSALGSTLEEHDERYKRIKNIKMNSIRRQYSQAGQSNIQ